MTIRSAWGAVRNHVEIERDFDFEHEHTLQFHLAWEIGRILGFPSELNVRFEVRTHAPPSRGIIQTDIVLWTDPNFRIALELKAPTKSAPNSPSAMTQGRMAFYKDIDRLCFLVGNRSSRIHRGMFLAVANERGYVMLQKQHKNLVYDTFHGNGSRRCFHPTNRWEERLRVSSSDANTLDRLDVALRKARQ